MHEKSEPVGDRLTREVCSDCDKEVSTPLERDFRQENICIPCYVKNEVSRLTACLGKTEALKVACIILHKIEKGEREWLTRKSISRRRKP